jgi:hypothetical protein
MYNAPMRPHPRIRKTVKWGGAVVSVVLLVVWVGSGWWYAKWGGSDWSVVLTPGSISLTDYGKLVPPEFHGWACGAHHFQFPWQWSFQTERGGGYHGYFVPLWALAFACILPAAIAWRLDILARRRARIGFCPKCGYNRTGLAPQAVCPECGAAAIVPPPTVS